MATDPLPAPVHRYFAAKGSSDPEATVACFTASAVVWDNGEDLEIRGLPAIREWMTGKVASYGLTSEIKDWQASGDNYEVNVNVSGDFPGSPYAFSYKFKVSGDRIAELSIDPIGPVNG